ncbi:imelysin family protein [Methyloprofundus sp.]|uniref:imelysin family protein n=1 Tax=Methyloprofundus sp. TaxID=2020875 RepID=UPI003D0E85F7
MKILPTINHLTAVIVLALSTSGPALALTQDYPVAMLGAGSATASIAGTIGGVPNSDGLFQVSDNLTVSALIPVAAEDVGSSGSFYAVVINRGQALMKTSSGAWLPWDGNIDNLQPAREDSALEAEEMLNVYRSLSGRSGKFDIFVGYKNSAGTLRYNSMPIHIDIKVDEADVLKGYVRLAHAGYEDALITALQLKEAVIAFIDNPSQATQDTAKAAWKAARIPYLQTETFRFSNPVVDEWEGKVNAWPLDEGLIDYVDTTLYDSELGNEWSQANIIANNANITIGGETLDASNITPELLQGLHEVAGSEANVATGYHAVEFLLWGQDLNGTEEGAGERSYTDYLSGGDCTNDNCDRRAQYLMAATVLLVEDLQFIVNEWDLQGGTGGQNYATEFLAGDAEEGLRKMLFGMGSLSFGELAGERMKVALIANSTEDEHDCFSDNTHSSYFFDALGIKNVYTGTYNRIDGSKVVTTSLAELVAYENADVSDELVQRMNDSQDAIQKIVTKAESGEAFDQLIAPGNELGAATINAAIQSLGQQTIQIEAVAEALGITNLNPDASGHEL